MTKSRRSPSDLILHIHPRTIPIQTLRFTLSWGLGGMALVLVLVLFTTGMLLLTSYQPSIFTAYESVETLASATRFGGWIRNTHHWSGNLLVMVSILHLMRVTLTGGFTLGRRLNWAVGLLLLFCVLLANFTGYLLPWDQLAYWAITICTSMLSYIPWIGEHLATVIRGGSEISHQTLSNFFVIHVGILPPVFMGLCLYHFWLVRRAGGLVQCSTKNSDKAERITTLPHLVVRELATALFLIGGVLLFSTFINAPLLEQANPGMSPNPAKAPWYFLGFQELLLHLHPLFATTIWPLLFISFLFLIPFIAGDPKCAGVWFGSRAGFKIILLWGILGFLFAISLVAGDFFFSIPRDPGQSQFTKDLISTLSILLIPVGLSYVLKKRSTVGAGELAMAGVTMLLVLMVTLTCVGIWFRGAEMALIFPWS